MTLRNVFGTPIRLVAAQRREVWVETGPGPYDHFVHERLPSRTYGKVEHMPGLWFCRYVYLDTGKKPTGHDWVHVFSLTADDGMPEIEFECALVEQPAAK